MTENTGLQMCGVLRTSLSNTDYDVLDEGTSKAPEYDEYFGLDLPDAERHIVGLMCDSSTMRFSFAALAPYP